MKKKKTNKIRPMRMSDYTWRNLERLKERGKSWDYIINELIDNWEVNK